MSDNKILKVTGESLDRLKIVLSMSDQYRVHGYTIDKDNKRMVLFWVAHPSATMFPTPMSLDTAASMIYDWIQNGAEFGKQPDHDGDNEKGWYAYTEGWGRIEDYGYQAFLAIEPRWMMYGK